jgi:hypothetical protein
MQSFRVELRRGKVEATQTAKKAKTKDRKNEYEGNSSTNRVPKLVGKYLKCFAERKARGRGKKLPIL